jgi:NADH:ubiquinone oxidoreductase subunit 3 (subunit A)
MFSNIVDILNFREYLFLFQYSFIALIISFLLFCISIIAVYQTPYKEKMSAYECGFNPYGDARSKFEVKYYIVGLLFIIFDLEICYVFP